MNDRFMYHALEALDHYDSPRVRLAMLQDAIDAAGDELAADAVQFVRDSTTLQTRWVCHVDDLDDVVHHFGVVDLGDYYPLGSLHRRVYRQLSRELGLAYEVVPMNDLLSFNIYKRY